MINAKKCPFCGSEPMTISTGNHFPEIYYRLICPKNCCMQSKLYDSVTKAITDWNARVADGETSDGYHTFDELYHHRAVLFSVIVKAFQEKAWKARLHNDGTMYDGMFIVGIDTPYGQASYHYDIDPYWDMFECRELERAPEWDGHMPALAIERIGKLEPVRHGKWVWNNDAIDYGIGAWVCSECLGRNENIHTGKPGTIEGFGTNPYIWAGSQFCPNCGAKMDGGKDDENA